MLTEEHTNSSLKIQDPKIQYPRSRSQDPKINIRETRSGDQDPEIQDIFKQ